MCVYRCVSSSTCEILTVLVRNVFSCSRLSVSLCKTEVNYVHIMLFLTDSNQEVVWFNVSMKEMSWMDILYSLDHLISKHKYWFKTELSFAVVEKILKWWAKEINDHNVIISFHAKPMNIWNANSSLQNPVQFCLIKQLRMLCSHRFLKIT